jgi:hypothetical protein
MVDHLEAKRLVERHIRESSQGIEDELVILDEHTIERPYGWVFFYDSRGYLETGELSRMLAGNAPVLVHKRDGHIEALGTALPVEAYLAKYESVAS